MIDEYGDNCMRQRRLSAVKLAMCFTWMTIIAIPRPMPAQQPVNIKANYSKSEQMIAMRDGVKLFTAIYSPKDTSQKYPILLSRTPYSCSPYGLDAYKETI